MPVRFGRVGHLAIGRDPRRAVGRVGHRFNRHPISLYVGVVHQNVDQHLGVLCRTGRVGQGHGRVVHRRDDDHDLCPGRPSVAVGHRVGEPVGAVPVRFGRVGHPAIGRDPRRAVGRVGHRLNRHPIALYVGVVCQNVDHHLGVFCRSGRVGHRNRMMVPASFAATDSFTATTAFAVTTSFAVVPNRHIHRTRVARHNRRR